MHTYTLLNLCIGNARNTRDVENIVFNGNMSGDGGCFISNASKFRFKEIRAILFHNNIACFKKHCNFNKSRTGKIREMKGAKGRGNLKMNTTKGHLKQ